VLPLLRRRFPAHSPMLSPDCEGVIVLGGVEVDPALAHSAEEAGVLKDPDPRVL
jgi:hypothetical protein